MFPLNRLQKGAQAFISGHALAKEVARGGAGLGQVQDFIEDNDAITVAVTGVGAAATAYVFIKRRELLMLWGLGLLIGSGVVEKAIQRILAERGHDVEMPVKIQVQDEDEGDGSLPQA